MGTFTACEPADELQNPNESNLDKSILKDAPTVTKQQEVVVPPYFTAILDKLKEVDINTYTVTFLDRVVGGTEGEPTTTFHYEVKGNDATPQLDSFYLDLPGCAGELLSYSPQQSANVKGNEIKWNNSVSKDGSQKYSLTFKGEISLGVINATVTRGSILESETILGPCAGIYNLSGSIYIDANNSGEKDPEETGIASIDVDLFDNDSGEKIGTVQTLKDGLYSFPVLEGDYSISVGNDLLEDENYTAVGKTSRNVGYVTEDLIDIDFGYLLNSDKVIDKLENNIIKLDTEPTKFWIQVIRQSGPNKNLYPPEKIRELLIAVENLHLDGPFFFGEDKEKAAVDILSRPIKSDLDLFLQQLLTAELNVVNGKGALMENGDSNKKFNDALIIYAEAIACVETGNCAAASSTTNAETKAIRSNDTRLLSAFNGSGGI